ncbi:MAG: AI-2E family transporter [Herminiimonas sp.]|nr:AI-2E family transporter [Herminiimonas sp.]
MKLVQPKHFSIRPQNLDAQPIARKRTLRVEITPLTMLCAVMVVGAIWMLERLVPVILVLIAALMMVGTLNPAVQWLERRRVGRNAGIAVVFVGMLVVLVALVTLTIPALLTQIMELVQQEPVLRQRAATFLASYQFTKPLAVGLGNVQYAALIKSSGTQVLAASKGVLEVLAYGAGAFFLALYIMIDGDRLRGAVFAVVPRSHHIRLSRILINLQSIVGGYLRGQAITCLCMGVFLFILLRACDVPNALAFAVFGAAVDVLPFLGIFLTMIPAVLAALVVSQGAAVIVFVLLLCYEEFESRVLIPLVYGRALRLPSSVVFFALLVGGTIYGIVGALLALPVAAALLMMIEELRVDLPGEKQDTAAIEQKVDDEATEAEYERRTAGMSAEAAAAIAVEISDTRKQAEFERERKDSEPGPQGPS